VSPPPPAKKTVVVLLAGDTAYVFADPDAAALQYTVCVAANLDVMVHRVPESLWVSVVDAVSQFVELRRACAVCARVLDALDIDGVLHWEHVIGDQPADHPAVPALPGSEVQVHARCDFCAADDPPWLLPARSFDMVGPVAAGSANAWAACDPCAALIRLHQWTALRRRSLALFAQRAGRPLAEVEASMGPYVNRLWRQLRANVTGPLTREGAGT